MKYLKNINNNFIYEKFLSKNNDIINTFVTAFLKTDIKYPYKLFHQYIFRTDTIDINDPHFFYKDQIVFTKDNKINFKKIKNIHKIFAHRISTFIGYTWSNSQNIFVPLFLSLFKYDDEDNYYIINGFTVWSAFDKTNTNNYRTVDYFNKDTTAEINQIDIDNFIIFDKTDTDIYIGNEKFESIKTTLRKYAKITKEHLQLRNIV